MFSISSFRTLAKAIIAGSALAASIPAGATAITSIDTFTITRSGIDSAGSSFGIYEGEGVFYRDGFSDGAVPPSGGSFFTGAAGTYNVLGSYLSTDESGGKLGLDSSLGGAFTNANGGSRTLQRSVLTTDADPDAQAGLKQAYHTFSVFGLFDLTTPPVSRDGYGIAINDGGPSGATESIDLFVRREENGNLVVRFQEQDFLNKVINTLELDALLSIPVGADQIELQLRRGDLSTKLLTASYRFWDEGSPIGQFITMSATADFFTNNAWARGAFFAVEGTAEVPEPGSLALLFAGMAAGLFAGRARGGRWASAGNDH